MDFRSVKTGKIKRVQQKEGSHFYECVPSFIYQIILDKAGCSWFEEFPSRAR